MNFRIEGGTAIISISESILSKMLEHIRKADRFETGGILIGYYTSTNTQAIVTKITGPSKDSGSGRSWFKRGTLGLSALLNRVWNSGEYYLGEWHFHPMASSVQPSPQDIYQMKEIAFSERYNCPEPIMIIIAGSYYKYTLIPFITIRKSGVIKRMIRVD